jgi:hypothetical protein
MLKQSSLITYILLSLITFGLATSATANSKLVGAANAAHGSYPSSSAYNQVTCPPVESLVQDSQKKWSAPDGWKSSDPAFVNSLEQFIGAQWAGINVGNVICLYVKGGRSDFPVALHKRIITLSPHGGSWSADKGGYKDCHSTDVRECPFETEQNVKTRQSIYEDLDFYKGQPVHN